MRRFTKTLLCAALAGLFPCAAQATVSFTLTDSVGTPSSVTVTRGQSFTVALKVISSGSDQITGLDYYLEALGNASGWFTVTGRSLTGPTSLFPQLYTDDLTWNVSPTNLLDPRIHDDTENKDLDMGGSVANVNSPVTNSTFQVANYTILVNALTPNDTYVIQTATPVGRGWVGPSPDFTDHEILPNLQGSYSVIVTPEPSILGLAGMGMMLIRMRPRRK